MGPSIGPPTKKYSIKDRNIALKIVAESVVKKLRSHYDDVVMREKPGCGNILLDALCGENSDFVRGYSIQKRILLETPVKGKKFFGLLNTSRTHDVEELCYICSPYIQTTDKSQLLVRVNEGPVIEACKEVAKGTNGDFSVKFTF